MLHKRRLWLERIAHWGIGLAVPLVAIVGFKLLASARDTPPPSAASPATPTRVYAPPVDAGAAPVVALRPPFDDPRCATDARATGRADAEARPAQDPTAGPRALPCLLR